MGMITPDISFFKEAFDCDGKPAGLTRLARGHIHTTYIGAFQTKDGLSRYILQRINQKVFPGVDELMGNIVNVTRYMRERCSVLGIMDANRRALELVPGRDGGYYAQDSTGDCWRCFRYIEDTCVYDLLPDGEEDIAGTAGRALGTFHTLIRGLDPLSLHEVIPRFHDTEKRLADLYRAIERDPENRAARLREDIAFVTENAPLCSALISPLKNGDIPLYIAHNDTKLNNFLFDKNTGEGLCLIDLDTVMPGTILYDFGDLMRTALSPAAEDERDLSRVKARMPVFAEIARGFLSTAPSCTRTEKELLPFSGIVLTLESGIRFLTDYCEGDRYFKISHEEHNLERARNQFALARSMIEHRDKMHRIVDYV